MEREQTWNQVTKTGLSIKKGWQELADRHGLLMNISGLPSLISFNLVAGDWLKYKTFITQEMLKKGWLASSAVYSCIDHSPEVIQRYIEQLDDIFEKIVEFENGNSIDNLLNGPICHSGFFRLN